MSTNKFIKRQEVEKMTSLSRATIYRLIEQGLFPPQIHISGLRSVGWNKPEIEKWMQKRIDASREVSTR